MANLKLTPKNPPPPLNGFWVMTHYGDIPPTNTEILLKEISINLDGQSSENFKIEVSKPMEISTYEIGEQLPNGNYRLLIGLPLRNDSGLRVELKSQSLIHINGSVIVVY